jgi:hypothetical protein
MDLEKLRSSYSEIKLAIFVDTSILSRIALEQLHRIKTDLQIEDHQIQIYRTDKDIEKVMEYNVIACPSLFRLDKRPINCLIGSLDNADAVKAFLRM